MPMQARIMRISLGCKSITEYWKFGARLKDWKTDVTAEWQKQGFDAVISPGFCAPALPIGYPAYCVSSGSYVSMYNVLNYPAGIVPVTKVTREDEDMMRDYPTPDMGHRWIKQGMSQDTVGLPVGVQCATLPWQDELCLRVMTEVEQSFKDG